MNTEIVAFLYFQIKYASRKNQHAMTFWKTLMENGLIVLKMNRFILYRMNKWLTLSYS